MLKTVWEILCIIFDLFVPRFVTEDVALELQEGAYVTVASMDALDGERYDAVCTCNCFTWLGIAWFGKKVGEVRPWPADLT